MIALGLLLLAAAVIVGLVGVFANIGGGHALNSDFTLFGYHPQGSTGQLLLIGIIIGAVGMLGLNMLLAGIGRGLTRRVSSRRELKQTQRQAHSLQDERERLAHQLEQERIERARIEAEQKAAAPPINPPTRPNRPPRSASPAPSAAGPAAKEQPRASGPITRVGPDRLL